MCGRFVVAGERSDLLGLFEIEFEGEELPGPSWNVRPTDRIAVVIDSKKGDEVPVRRLEGARWSFVPPSSPTLKTKFPSFNARSETAATKSLFAGSVKSRRALIPASGYYEWKTAGKVKTPYFIHPAEGMMAFAGLYSWWRDDTRAPDDPARWILTTTILTMEASGELRDIHDRTPVALPGEWWDEWLDPTTEGDQGLVDAAVAASADVVDFLAIDEVAPLTNDDHAGLINPL